MKIRFADSDIEIGPRSSMDPILYFTSGKGGHHSLPERRRPIQGMPREVEARPGPTRRGRDPPRPLPPPAAHSGGGQLGFGRARFALSQVAPAANCETAPRTGPAPGPSWRLAAMRGACAAPIQS